MKPTHLAPVTLIGSVLSFSLLGFVSQAHATTFTPPPIDSSSLPGPIDNANNLTSVDVELALILDSSNSISQANFNGILSAYYNIFTSPTFFNDFIAPLRYDTDKKPQIAVSFFQFGTNAVQSIPWTIISNQNDAQTFGNQFLSITKKGGFTNMGGAIKMATQTLLNNEFAGKYSVFDISSDGRSFRSDPPVIEAAADAFTAGIDAINAIAVSQNSISVLPNVIGGLNPDRKTAGFIVEAGSIDNYEATLRDKLKKELQGDSSCPFISSCPPDSPDPLAVPEPSAIWGLLGIGLLAVGRSGVRPNQ